ncbi:MAG TPA: mandelate racemase/muconate lactonizing enzyme family protein [Humisphaera sp.]|jgi:L-alanine-DL-glutamate epimerase-like enolase superfamily enzyme|nr:mandelate racemase/muconate lactonizing enzyme family protein [Humisphaera sp.]
MKRRTFLKSLVAASCATLLRPQPTFAALPKAKITKVTAYAPPNLNILFNQSNIVVTIETDAGITGIGEGGAHDTLEQCAGRLIGRNPFDIERCWQDMYRAFFYPPGREKLHALGALDLALWDIKGKALNVPVYDLLGGMNRNHCECYVTAPPIGSGLKERAQAVIGGGYRAFRLDAASVRGTNVYNTRERVHKLYHDCKEIRDAIGPDADWLIDFHQRFDYPDALRACKLLEELEPYLIEDPVKTDAFNEDIPKLRKMTTAPLAAGEEWGNRYDFNKLVENHDLDYIRATLPNVGGITEMTKIMALCETHNVGIVPHFTGPISTAALVHTLGPYSGPVLFEYTFGGREIAYLPECLTFKNGKLWPNERVGLGVTVDFERLKKIAEFTTPITDRATYIRPDGSQTNW